MDFRYKFDLEVRINELASRRRMLDKQLEVRSSTLAELGQVREMSMKRLCNAVEAQNEQARVRNQELREYIYSSSSSQHRNVLKPDSQRSANKLKEAKEQYLKHVEATLPIWHRYQTVQLEENVRNIQMEKALSLKRREQLQSELMRENEAKQQLERHRQELLYSLAAEQRIILESKANAILLEEESKATNAQVAHELSLSANAMNELVAANVYQMRQGVMQQTTMPLKQSAEILMRPPALYQPHPYQPAPEAAHTYRAAPQPAHPAGHSSYPHTSEVDDMRGRVEVPVWDASLLMSPAPVERSSLPTRLSVAATPQAYHSQGHHPQSPAHHASVHHTPSHQTIHHAPAYAAQSHQQSFSQHNTTATSPLTQASQSMLMHTQMDADMTFTTAIGANDSTLNHSVNNTFSSAHKPLHDHKQHTDRLHGENSAHQRLFGSVLDTHHEVEEPTSPDTEEKEDFSSFSAPSQLAAQIVRTTSLDHSTHSSGGLFINPHSAYEEGSHLSPALSPAKPHSPSKLSSPMGSGSPRSSFAVAIEVRPGSRHASPQPGSAGSGSGKGGFFAEDDHHTVHRLSRMNSTTFSEAGSSKNHALNDVSNVSSSANIAALVEGLSIPQCAALLGAVCKEIERRATEFPAPVSVTTIYDTQSRHRAVHIIDAFLTSGSADNANLNAVLNNAADSTLGNAVLAMVDGKSNILIPR